jgi:hypothetical protein
LGTARQSIILRAMMASLGLSRGWSPAAV